MRKKCHLIGVFPPPYGGATVKCKLFSELLQKEGYDVEEIDIYGMKRNKKKIITILLACMKAFCSKKPIIYCLDSKRLNIITLLQCLCVSSFSITTIVVVGGTFNEVLIEMPLLGKRLKKVKNIWVETIGLKNKLENMGFSNIEVFPNPKNGEGSCKPQRSDSKSPLKILFFSQISREKGVEDIIKLVELLNNEQSISYEMDFYGHVVPEFNSEFTQFIENIKNVRYLGIYNATKESVYRKLNEYDVLLFPTYWAAEGVPGILVEAKMAGLAVIASNRCYNSEIIREDQMEGILLYDNYPKEMFNAIKRLFNDREYLLNIKEASYRSRKRYDMSNFKNILNKL